LNALYYAGRTMTESETNPTAPPAKTPLWQEVVQCWRQMPEKSFFLTLLATWTLLFHFWGNSTFGVFGRPTPSLFEWMGLVYWTSEDDFHGLFVLPGVLVLLYLKREELLALPRRVWWPALGLFVPALLLHVAGYLVQQPRLSIVAYFAGLYALTGLAWGWPWLRATFFPMFLFAFCVPLGAVGDALTLPLRMIVSKISVFISQTFLGISVLRDGVQIFSPTGGFRYEVAAACSGIRSLTSLLALTTIYAFLSFKSPWRRLLMVFSAAPLAIFGNVVRLTVVILAAEAFGQKAGERIETKFGFVTFALAMVGVFVLGWWMRERNPQAASPTPGAAPAP
jgi:exosortase